MRVLLIGCVGCRLRDGGGMNGAALARMYDQGEKVPVLASGEDSLVL